MTKNPTPVDAAPTLPPTSRSLPIVLIRARETVMAPIRKMLADTGLTEQQWRVLRVLSEGGLMEASRVAQRASLLLPSLTRIALGMRDKGLITQERDTADKRRQLMAITPQGQAIIDANSAESLRIVQGFRDQMGAEDYEKLLDLLERLERMHPDHQG